MRQLLPDKFFSTTLAAKQNRWMPAIAFAVFTMAAIIGCKTIGSQTQLRDNAEASSRTSATAKASQVRAAAAWIIID